MKENTNKHLTFDDRLVIQAGLQEKLSLAAISRKVGKNRSTISREIKNHRKLVTTSGGNNCVKRNKCKKVPSCRSNCYRGKKNCQTACGGCNEDCIHYQEEFCAEYEKPPYVCNGCTQRLKCRLRRMLYDAKHAQASYEELRTESRRGISLTEQDLAYLDQLISPEIRKGLSIPVVCELHRDEIPVSVRTIYSYVDNSILSARNLDLRRKLQRPERKKSGPVLRVDKQCHIGRSYEEYQQYIKENPDGMVTQMDSVIIRSGGQSILTLFFTNCDLQLMYLRDRNTSASVTAVFKELQKKLGVELYQRLLQIVLTDRGSEFTDPIKIEVDSETGEVLSHVFYCNPMNSNQKSNCERNHELIRYIIPKRTAKERYTQEEIRKTMNHINSYPRKKWNGQSPIKLFKKLYGEETANLLGLEQIPSDSINLTPGLLK